MLVIISDLHLTDGTSGQTIGPHAFKIFRGRLREMAYEASWRTTDAATGKYVPIEEINLVLLGDILDVIRSKEWLNTDNIRPWSDKDSRPFKDVIKKINEAILEQEDNSKSFEILRSLNTRNGITLPPATKEGKPGKVGFEPNSEGRKDVKVNIHYMVGNHDWFYHLKGDEYNAIRKTVVDKLGLANDPGKPFAHDPEESPDITRVLDDHNVYACHGDKYDQQNYNQNRDVSSIGDAIVVELLNRFPSEVKDQLGDKLPEECLQGLDEIDNVRPLEMIPEWIASLLAKTCHNHPELVKQVNEIWDKLTKEFLKPPFVRKQGKWWKPFDEVGILKLGLRATKKLSFNMLASGVKLFKRIFKGRGETYHKYALKEQAFIDKKASFIVYGHTHHMEVVPLDTFNNEDQMYINSGTWRAVFEKARARTNIAKFVDHKVMTYLAFFKDDERGGRKFEVWSGSLGKKTTNI